MPSTLQRILVKTSREAVLNVIIQSELPQPICGALLSYKEAVPHLRTKAVMIAD